MEYINTRQRETGLCPVADDGGFVRGLDGSCVCDWGPFEGGRCLECCVERAMLGAV